MHVDLHIHSRHSSGTQSVEAIFAEARAKGLGLISLTDDNTTEAYDEVPAAAAETGVGWITGAQISTRRGHRTFRLLAYGFDRADADLQALLADARRAVEHLFSDLIALLARHHAEISEDGYRDHVHDPAYGGFRFNSYLDAVGLDGSETGMRKIVLRHAPSVIRLARSQSTPPIDEVVRVVHRAGGRLVVPGGYMRNPLRIRRRLEQLLPIGVEGFEVFSNNQGRRRARVTQAFARERGLLTTAGSDAHGTWSTSKRYFIGKPRVELAQLNLGDIEIHQDTTATFE